MSAFLKLGAHALIHRLISSDFPGVGSKVGVGIGFAVFSGVMLIVAAVFFIYAAYLWADINYTRDVAAAAAGAVALFFSVLGMCAYFGIYYFKLSKMSQAKDEVLDCLERSLEKFEEVFSEPVRENPKAAAALSSVVGYQVGSKFL